MYIFTYASRSSERFAYAIHLIGCMPSHMYMYLVFMEFNPTWQFVNLTSGAFSPNLIKVWFIFFLVKFELIVFWNVFSCQLRWSFALIFKLFVGFNIHIFMWLKMQYDKIAWDFSPIKQVFMKHTIWHIDTMLLILNKRQRDFMTLTAYGIEDQMVKGIHVFCNNTGESVE